MSHPMHDVLGRWKAAFDNHQPDVIAELYTTDALFQGFGPTVVAGRDAVRAYYEAVDADRRADVTVLHTYTLGDHVAGGFADVTFSGADGWEAKVHCPSSCTARTTTGRSASTTSPGSPPRADRLVSPSFALNRRRP